MIIGIDATNIRSGGGVTHLVEILSAVNPRNHNITKVVVWASITTLEKIDNKPWIIKKHEKVFEENYLYRSFWQRVKLSDQAKLEGCDVLFVPGGSLVTTFHPTVTMNRNLLPFEWREIKNYGLSLFTIKLILLRNIQKYSLRRADGVIFLTSYARKVVTKITGKISGKIINIPHGISDKFYIKPDSKKISTKFSLERPCKILYVSTIDIYKHQDSVVESIKILRNQGFPVSLELVGGSYAPTLKKINEQIDKSGVNKFIQYTGVISYKEIQEKYASADIGVFASSCETFGQILMEKMASGLPIACSDRSCMPELLNHSGVYFDPESPSSVADAIKELLKSSDVGLKNAKNAYQISKDYSWDRCAYDTFNFLKEISNK